MESENYGLVQQPKQEITNRNFSSLRHSYSPKIV